MLRRTLLSSYSKRTLYVLFSQNQTFLTNTYSCSDAWNSRFASPILNKVNLEEFYTSLDQNFNNKGVISAIDVDIFANSIKDSSFLDESRDLIHKLRLSADTRNTLDSTHQAIIRNYLEYGNIQDVINILKDPLNFGIFMDNFTANILLDKLLKSHDYENATTVASQIMLQEDFSNVISCALSQYACYKYILAYVPPEPELPPETKVKVEEVKIRIKFLRNPYFDDHFDIQDPYLLAGKTLAWISEKKEDNLNKNLEILGWLVYHKYDKLLKCCELAVKVSSFKVYKEILDLIQRESSNKQLEQESSNVLQKCLSLLNSSDVLTNPIEESLKNNVENAINQQQKEDIDEQEKLFKRWSEIREEKLNEQVERLDRAKRLELIEEKQKMLQMEEQKLWFFENEEKIDLEIESKEALQKDKVSSKGALGKSDDDYIPPEIVRKRR